MRAGGMKARLQLLRPVTTTNAYGEDVVVWQEAALVHAERAKLSGRAAERVAEHWHDYSALFLIRSGHAVEEGWRARQVGGTLYHIAAVEPNPERGYNALVCDRVNE